MVNTADSIFSPVVQGTFYRAIDPRFHQFAIAGSRTAGRYSRAHEPTLYLSSSVEGVEAALLAHRGARSRVLEVIEIDVEASGIVDLRDPGTVAKVGIEIADAASAWQEIAASGGTPPSWSVRDRLLEVGASGLIDPSRKRPGLWHLVLFHWNEPGAPSARLRESPRS
ncbi:RES family NAD+ phosphorylase [Curtobacterium flaccumfaciens]|jgi:RES domain-containing protein|uniref:RES family NAD+ phosphorylase n=1 Tax=Curtobacterium flaccumfaciens TaxID=2035 RepID=UPI0009D9C158|nr:RES family NAD+ phosphorylase [Curtobacterium flaccumfaciens]TPG07142.1 RES domain-containing protein [Curtobacterium flaccumfaciens]